MTHHPCQKVLMTGHPNDRPPWWQTICVRDHWWKTTLMTYHPSSETNFILKLYPSCFHVNEQLPRFTPLPKPLFLDFQDGRQTESNNVSSLCHCSLPEGGPRYLSELLHKYTPSSASLIFWQLHASCANHKQKDFQRKIFLDFTGPTVWNSLPFEIRSLNSTPSFKHIFSRVTSYPT